MGFIRKTWKDRLSEHPIRRILTPTDGSAPMEVDVTRAEGTVMQPGDAFSAENMNDLERRIEDAIGGGDTNMAPIEESSQASNAYVVGDMLIYSGLLYRVISPISVGNSLVEGVNIIPTTISAELINSLTANGVRLYMDYQEGRFGYNTSPSRGADTFHPFSADFRLVVGVYVVNYQTPHQGNAVSAGGWRSLTVTYQNKQWAFDWGNSYAAVCESYGYTGQTGNQQERGCNGYSYIQGMRFESFEWL